MKIEGTDIKIHAEALGRALRDSGKTKAGSTVLALGEYVKELESRLEQAENDAAKWNMLPAVAYDHQIDLMALYRDIDTAMQSAKESQ